MKRKTTALRAISLTVCLILSCGAASAADPAQWKAYKDAFISKDGRTIDRYQSQASHSEGQGYAMLLSAAYGDRDTFDSLWRWTRENLGVRADALFAWQWGKRIDGQWAAIDYNNATDGDILIAYALLKASSKWKDNAYRDAATPVIKGIRKNLSISSHGKTFLLPSHFGFTRASVFVLNPSYLILPAFKAFAVIDDAAFWEKLHSDSARFLSETCFGAMCLPADWVFVSGGKAGVWNERPPLFGNEAVRTFLYISMAGTAQFPKGLERMLDYYEKNGYIPFWVDLEKDSVSLSAAPAGHYAVFALAAKKAGRPELGKKLYAAATERLKAEKDDYYSFSLYLLSESAGEK